MTGMVTAAATIPPVVAAKAPEKPDAPKPPDAGDGSDDVGKKDGPDAPVPPKKSAAPTERKLLQEVYLQLDMQADLRDLDALPVGQERLQTAVDRLRETASDSQGKILGELQAKIDEGNLPVEVELGDRLWINNSMVVKLFQKAGAAASPFAEKPEAAVELVKGLKGVQAATTVDKLKFETPPIDSFLVDGNGPASDAAKGGAAAQPGALPWNLEMIGVQAARDAGLTGKGIVVASLDTGVDVRHPALWSKYRGYSREDGFDHEQNYIDATAPAVKPGQALPEPKDKHGHGTHVTGSMVGNDGVTGQIGVAPDAKFIGAKGLGDGGGSTLDLLKGMEYLMAPVDGWGQGDARQAPHIINHSWGGPGPSLDFTMAARNMAKAGIVNVFAAGNNGYSRDSQTLGDPGMQEHGITVGAIDRHGDLARFSSTGPSNVTDEFKPLVVAPGVDIMSSVPDGKYAKFSGTSMAAPHVSGALAVVDQALAERGQSLMDLEDAKFVLERMTRDLDVEGPDDRTGYGLIDLTKMNDALDALVAQRNSAA